jgi:hypothetical protein
MRFSAGKQLPKTPKTSDFGDLMHLIYSPYVDIFRCDAAFGPHLKSHAPVRARDRRSARSNPANALNLSRPILWGGARGLLHASS